MGNGSVAIIGGTGALGFGLALRLAKAGRQVIVGSRRSEAAEAAAEEIRGLLTTTEKVSGLLNEDAAHEADMVILAVPYGQQEQALDAIAEAVQGKILIDTTVPLLPPKVGTVQLPATGCSALGVQERLGDNVTVVSAFQNVSAKKLRGLQPLECDVLISGDDADARQIVVDLAESIGARAHHAGPLANAAAAEALTSVLITLNRRHKCESGIRIVGLEG